MIVCQVNWTATYRTDSTIVAPYGRFASYADVSPLPVTTTSLRSYAVGKTKLVAWFASNCDAKNGRLDYVHELMTYIGASPNGAFVSFFSKQYIYSIARYRDVFSGGFFVHFSIESINLEILIINEHIRASYFPKFVKFVIDIPVVCNIVRGMIDATPS